MGTLDGFAIPKEMACDHAQTTLSPLLPKTKQPGILSPLSRTVETHARTLKQSLSKLLTSLSK
jgi:hypothetical protein